MNAECRGVRIDRSLRARAGAFLVLTLVALPAVAGEVGPTFSKTFLPDTIGPGSTSTLEFDIFNTDSIPVSNLEFTDDLPDGVVIATPSSSFTDCTEGILSAPDGGSTIGLSGGQLGPESGCTVTVNVTSDTVGTHTNISGDLTSSAGNSGSATADLTVDGERPGFKKSFAPSSVPPRHTSTLTLLIDNTANPAATDFLSFVDNLPAGMFVATRANASTDCRNAGFPGTLTATPGTGFVSLNSGFVAAQSSCTVTVDVTTDTSDIFVNTTGELLAGFSPSISSGFASAQLDVPFVFLNKIFTDDPVPPGQTVTLEFIITNRDRDRAATSIAFTDDLTATLPGLSAVGLPMFDVCGTGSVITGSTLLSFASGNLAPDSTCAFSVTLQVPAAATFGTFTNTTSSVTLDLGGESAMEDPATDDLIVAPVPLFTKEFTDDPVAPDATVTLEFTVTNSHQTLGATEISFTDNLTAVIPGLAPTAMGLPSPGFCGNDSTMTTFFGPFSELFLSMTGGELAAAAACTFEVTLQVPSGVSPGPYLNTTSSITTLLGGEEPVEGSPATDELIVAGVAAPVLAKSFTDDPVAAGQTVTLEFTITNSDGTDSTTDLAFTDDLAAVLPGLVATDLPLTDVCGIGSRFDGTTVLSLTGGSLAPATSCTFAATLQVPGDASPGIYPNTTSDLSGNVGGAAVTGDPATDDLLIAGLLQFRKDFIDDPVAPGQTVTLDFTLNNTSATDSFDGLEFTDDLDAALPGLVALNLPANDICGTGSQIAGAGLLTFTGGSVAPQSSCTFSVTLQVPAGAMPTEYLNTTSEVMDENEAVVASPASDQLIVADLLTLLKSFSNDPAVPGGTVTLGFSVGYSGQSETATEIAFTDDLTAVLPGLAALDLPANDVCGPGSLLTGTTLLELTGGNLTPGQVCTFDVTLGVPAGALPGSYPNTTSQITALIGGEGVTGEPATDDLQIAGIPVLAKQFTDDPVGPGSTVDLEFAITNTNASNQATDIAFTDDLDAVLSGLAAMGLPQSDVCGPGSLLDGTSVVTLTGGNLPPGQACTFDITLDVPAGVLPGSYPNATSQLTAAIGGVPVTGNRGIDALQIEPLPLLEKSFTDDPVGAGGTVNLEFTITNTDALGQATAIAFTDDLDAVISGLVAMGLPQSDVCGPGSLLDGTSVVTLTGGNLDPGATCVFSATLQLPTGIEPGNYLNTTSPIIALVQGSSVEGAPASDELEVTPAPLFSKSFLDAPVEPGDTVTLEFTILLEEATDPANDIAFTDDLNAVIPGLAALGLPIADVCGPGSLLTGTTLLELTGGNLQPGFSCSFGITLQVPGNVPSGIYPNTTSQLTAIVGGVAVIGNAAQADLVIAGAIAVAKEFTDDPVVAGAPVTLEFTLTNSDLSFAATDIQFTDDLDAVLSGLVAVGLPATDICGTGSAIDGTLLLTFTGGNLAPGTTCTFAVTLQVPADATSGEYPNTTSQLTAMLDGEVVMVPPATDVLVVAEGLSLSKSFTDDPAFPGGSVTLEFTVNYLGGSTDATGISFTDDLEAVLSGLVAVGLPANDICGTGSQISGTSLLELTGGTLTMGSSCTFSVTLQVPTAALAGSYSNLTSQVTAMVAGLEINGPAAGDDLEVIAGLEFEKLTNGQDADVPPGPTLEIGDPVTWEYVLTNLTGDVLRNIVVADSQGVSVSCPQDTLAPDDTLTCTGTGIVMPGQYSNVGTASGISGNRQLVVTDPSHYLGIDTRPPTVTNVDSMPNTGDDQLEDCETAQVSIRQLLVSFSEPVQDPPGDTQPDDVTNRENYLLVASGPDNDIQTLACGPAMDDDVAIAISGVAYDGLTQTATLDLESILPNSLHRLLVCGSTSIRDLAGNALDGDNNGIGGDDYEQIFRSDPANLLANGHFDCGLVDWFVSETIPGTVNHSTEDVDNSSLSGSAQIFNPSPTGSSESFALAQCMQVQEQAQHSLASRTRLEAAPGVFVSFIESCEFFDQASCGGSSLGVALSGLLLQDTGGMWISIAHDFAVPASTASALCMFRFDTATGDAFEGFLDDTVLDDRPLFADGFESGDTSAWSTTVP